MTGRWKKETNYFCNLEKKHYLERVIPKIFLDDNTMIVEPEHIRREQNFFLQQIIYQRSDPVLGDYHREKFLQYDNQYITKPTEEEVGLCEFRLTLQECLSSLKT